MDDYVEAAKTGALADGQMTRLTAGGHEILLARVGDIYYATAPRCPHMGGDLARGTLEGTVLTCPRHHSQFDLTDGRVVRWTDWTGVMALGKLLKSPRPLATYPVKVEEDRIFVSLRAGQDET